MKTMLFIGLAACAMAGLPTEASAAKLLYRAYTNAGQLYGAMLFDTNKPWTFDGASRVQIPTMVFSSPTADISIVKGVKDHATFHEPLVTGFGSSAFGHFTGVNAPADSRLFQHENGYDSPVLFGTGTYGVYAPPADFNQPTSAYRRLGDIVVTDVTDKTVNIIAQTDYANNLQFLAITYGDKPASRPIADGGFALTDFEGTLFDGLNQRKLETLEFLYSRTGLLASVRTESTVWAGPTLFTGPNTDPDMIWLMDPTDPNGADAGLPGNQRLFMAQSKAQLASAVPEPATWATMMLGFGLVGSAMRRRVARLRTAA